MNEERLKQLRRVVESAPDERFHMGQFCTPGTPRGTAYRAAGWAALDPWFRQNTSILGVFATYTDASGWKVEPRYPETTFNDLDRIFDISEQNASRLFGGHLAPEDDATKDEVIANIDRLLAGQDAELYRPWEVSE